MSLHTGGEAQGGSGAPVQPYRPQTVRPTQLQQSSGQYCYETQSTPPPTFSSLPNTGYMPPRPDYMCYPPPVTPPAQSTVNQCLPRPTYPVGQSYPIPPCFPPVPPPSTGPPTAQSTYPYMVPPLMPPPPMMPPPLPHVGYQPVYPSGYPPQTFPPPLPPPQPVPSFNNYQQNSTSFQGSSHYRHTSHGQYQTDKPQSDHRTPDRGKHYDAHRHREYSHSDRHRSEKHGDRRDRGRSPDRARRQDSSRRRSEHEYSRAPSRGRTPPRHGSYERSSSAETLQKINYNTFDGTINRQSHCATYEVQEGLPLNPMGRTGLRGRGSLCWFGPNHAVHPIITQWKRNKDGSISRKKSKKMLEVLVMKRSSAEHWALPGGSLEPGEGLPRKLKRIFKYKFLETFQNLMSKSIEVYKGYVDDPRNTDNAWIETTAKSIHYDNHDDPLLLELNENIQSHDEEYAVQWQVVDQRIPLYANHKDILQKAVDCYNAYY